MRISGISSVGLVGRARMTKTSEVDRLARAVFYRIRVAERLGKKEVNFLLANDDITKIVLDRINKLYKNVEVSDSDNINVKVSFKG